MNDGVSPRVTGRTAPPGRLCRIAGPLTGCSLAVVSLASVSVAVPVVALARPAAVRRVQHSVPLSQPSLSCTSCHHSPITDSSQRGSFTQTRRGSIAAHRNMTTGQGILSAVHGINATRDTND